MVIDGSAWTRKIPPGQTIRREGVIVKVGSWYGVNVDGNVVEARWADPLVVVPGDPVLVDLTRNGPRGQFMGYVLCRLAAAPRPGYGKVTVVPPSSETISVLGDDSVTYTARFVSSYTPAVNDNVILAWNASQPTVIGETSLTPPPVPEEDEVIAVPPPPAPKTTGSNAYAATDSSTFSPQLGGWDRWAGGGGHLYQGSWGGYTLFGSWFYNGQPKALAGRTITRLRIRLGARRHVGSYNSAVTLTFYAHTSPTRPGGDVTRVGSAFNYVMQPNQGATTIDLPVAFGATLQAGGGISIAGSSYAGLNGRLAQPDSGTLTLNWTR